MKSEADAQGRFGASGDDEGFGGRYVPEVVVAAIDELTESYERIHRSNLIGMGVLPLEFKPGESRETLVGELESLLSNLGADDLRDMSAAAALKALTDKLS